MFYLLQCKGIKKCLINCMEYYEWFKFKIFDHNMCYLLVNK
jgi:hypothetical protein